MYSSEFEGEQAGAAEQQLPSLARENCRSYFPDCRRRVIRAISDLIARPTRSSWITEWLNLDHPAALRLLLPRRKARERPMIGNFGQIEMPEAVQGAQGGRQRVTGQNDASTPSS